MTLIQKSVSTCAFSHVAAAREGFSCSFSAVGMRCYEFENGKCTDGSLYSEVNTADKLIGVPRMRRQVTNVIASCVMAAALTNDSVLTQRAFEVASLKPETRTQPGRLDVAPGGRIVATNVTLPALLMFSYDVRGYRVIGIPEWANRERFSIEAKAENRDASMAELREMMRSLLAERFKLRVHRETRDLDGFELLRVNGNQLGPQIQRSSLHCTVPERIRQERGCGMMFNAGELQGGDVSMAELGEWLDSSVGAVIIDRTEMREGFDLKLKWSPDPAVPDSISLFTALREQLGLKLERRKVPSEVLVVDYAERPSAN